MDGTPLPSTRKPVASVHEISLNVAVDIDYEGRRSFSLGDALRAAWTQDRKHVKSADPFPYSAVFGSLHAQTHNICAGLTVPDPTVCVFWHGDCSILIRDSAAMCSAYAASVSCMTGGRV